MVMTSDDQLASPSLAQVVHATWRDTMLAQGREVASERLDWALLSEEDLRVES